MKNMEPRSIPYMLPLNDDVPLSFDNCSREADFPLLVNVRRHIADDLAELQFRQR